jgi:hypothetical protein
MEQLNNIYTTLNFLRFLDVKQKAKLLFFWIATEHAKHEKDDAKRALILKEIRTKFLEPHAVHQIISNLTNPEIIAEFDNESSDSQLLESCIKAQHEVAADLKQEIAVFLDSPKAHGNYRKLKNC